MGGGKNQAKTVYDPCPVGWRVPNGMKASASWYSPWNYNSMAGYVSTSRASGNYMNQTVGSTMLWAAAGHRSTNGHIYYAGIYGYYWFATASSATGGYCGYFDTTQALRDYTYTKGYGFSIRCVKDN